MKQLSIVYKIDSSYIKKNRNKRFPNRISTFDMILGFMSKMGVKVYNSNLFINYLIIHFITIEIYHFFSYWVVNIKNIRISVVPVGKTDF